MKVYVGLDPGKDGFVTLYSKELGYQFHEMPTEKVGTGEYLKSGKEKTKSVFSEKGVLILSLKIREFYGEDATFICCIEEVTGRHGWSAQTNFSFGHTAGIQKSLLYLLSNEVHMIRPQKWQSYMYESYDKVMIPNKTNTKMVHDTKATSAKVSQLMEPSIDFRKTKRSTKIHDGKTDSFLICKFCEKMFGGIN